MAGEATRLDVVPSCVRKLQNIRSDSILVEDRSAAGEAAALVAFPLALLIVMAWVFGASGGGALIVSLGLGGVVVWMLQKALPRKLRLELPNQALLVWAPGLEDQDNYRVLLRAGLSEKVLFEQDDPAQVLADVRRVCQQTRLRFEGPDWARSIVHAVNETDQQVTLLSGSEEGTYWLAQRETAWAVAGGGVFVFLVFLGSVRWEAELSSFSAVLPLVSIALMFFIAALLFSLRIRVTATSETICVDRILFGYMRRQLQLSRPDILSARAVGHTDSAPRHLLFDTREGPRAIALAGEAALLAAAHICRETSSDPAAHAGSGEHNPSNAATTDFLSHS